MRQRQQSPSPIPYLDGGKTLANPFPWHGSSAPGTLPAQGRSCPLPLPSSMPWEESSSSAQLPPDLTAAALLSLLPATACERVSP